jgi:hypothetical protein
MIDGLHSALCESLHHDRLHRHSPGDQLGRRRSLGHTTIAVSALIAAAILLYLHDVAIGIVLAMAIARASSSNRT